MALSGFFLSGFLVIHAAGNSLIFQSRDIFAAYAQRLHSLGLLFPCAELLLLGLFVFHISLGLHLVLYNRQAKGQNYAIRQHRSRWTWVAISMPYSGLGLLAFLLLHLFTVRFADPDISVVNRVSAALSNPFPALFYVLGLVALALHLGHGLWSMFQSLGLYHPRWNGLIRASTLLLTLALVAVFADIILLHWFYF
jgi:succinate dehydrogenase / fumarate reductase cytochrome b subunit